MRAAIYARVSTRERQDVANQLRQLHQHIAAHGWTPAGEYCDHESGRNAERPEFLRMLEDARRRKFDVLVFWSLDRLSREGALATLEHLQFLTRAGVKWRSYTEQYLDTCGAFKDAVVAILGAMARQERVRLGERTRAGMERARAQGKTLGRPRLILDTATLREKLQRAPLAAVCAEIGASEATIRRRLRAANA